MPEAQAVNVRNRSYTIGALVDIPAPGAEGVLFAHGSRFGGHALYVKDNRLHYVYNFVGMFEQKIDGTEDLPVGENLILSASFDKDGEDPPGVATGILSLYHGDTKVGEGRIKTQPGLFSLAGEGLCVGRDSGEPVTGDYPGESPAPLHRRHDQAGRRRRQRRPLRRPRARGPGHARPRVDNKKSARRLPRSLLACENRRAGIRPGRPLGPLAAEQQAQEQAQGTRDDDDRHGLGLPLRVSGADHHRRPAARQSGLPRPGDHLRAGRLHRPIALAVEIGHRAGTPEPASELASAHS